MLRTAILSRYHNIAKRSLKYHIPPPDKDGLIKLVETHYLDGFKCTYCYSPLKVNEAYPSLHVFSIDHKRPLALNGTNDNSNLVICCHCCNIIKGTMTADTFIKLLSYIPNELKEVMFREIYRGRLADKLERIKNEKMSLKAAS